MATDKEIAAFEHFQFRVGQKVKTKLRGNSPDTGIVVQRVLLDVPGGICRQYVVRYNPERRYSYFEFELEETI